MSQETRTDPPPSTVGGVMIRTSASYGITMRVRLPDRPGMCAQLATAIAGVGASLGAIDLVRVEGGEKVRDVTVSCAD